MSLSELPKSAVLATAVLFASGCATPHLGVQRYAEVPRQQWVDPASHYGRDYPYQATAPLYTPVPAQPNIELPRWIAEPPPLSPGDRLQVAVQNGDEFSGLFEVDIDGALKLPYLPSLSVAGQHTAEAEHAIADALVAAELFHAHRVAVSVRVQQWAPVQVHVSGAVFNPGLVSANVRSAEERAQKSLQDSGDFPPERLLPAALRAAGGVRPDAAVNAVKLIRNGESHVVDLSSLMQGYPVAPVALMSGDTIIVPSTGHFNSILVAPSAITPPGIRVFLSNLTSPSSSNASSAVGKHATSLPYGSRLLTAAISANCVGGTNTTNASRHVVLVRTDPMTGREEAIERPIHNLLRAPERNDVNPFVMPNDSVACYDSGITNLRDIARTLGDILLPFSLFTLL